MLVNAGKEELISFLDYERERLNSIVGEKQFDFKNEEVQKASQRMDQVILYWYRINQIKSGLKKFIR